MVVYLYSEGLFQPTLGNYAGLCGNSSPFYSAFTGKHCLRQTLLLPVLVAPSLVHHLYVAVLLIFARISVSLVPQAKAKFEQGLPRPSISIMKGLQLSLQVHCQMQTSLYWRDVLTRSYTSSRPTSV